jgi:hypothetical protein
MRCIASIIVIFVTIGCQKEKITFYQAYIKNNTAHQVKLMPYFAGVAPSSKIIVLTPGDSVQVAQGTDRGKANHAGFNSVYFSGSDSIIVVFDNVHPISHYLNTPLTFSSKYYLYSSPRNIENYLNWSYSFQDVSKSRREAFYLYRFVEQDYLDAQ